MSIVPVAITWLRPGRWHSGSATAPLEWGGRPALCISFTITPRQFALAARQPWSVVAGLALNFIFMPALCWALARPLVRDPQLAVGVILVGIVPCVGMAVV